jgi:DNA-binding response OmpR family regulator
MTKGMLSGLHVLIVEDEFFLADDLKQTLVGHGANVVGPAPTPEAGLQAMELFHNIDFAVLDVHLREHDVFPVSAALQERGIPFLFATGFDEAQIPAEYRHVPRLEKPFDADALVAAIGAALAVAEPRRRPAG